MTYVRLLSTLIESAGYDAQCALLEVRLIVGGRIFRYNGVPEEVWYRLREDICPDDYFRRYICGSYPEVQV